MRDSSRHPFSGQAEDAPMWISIVIVTYKRRDALLRALESARAQEYPYCEVIVVDNNSGDDLQEYLSVTHPEATFVGLTTNTGAGGGRNAGIAAARGDIIITLDDDVYFESTSEVGKIADIFQARPDIHVLALQLCDAITGELRVREWCHPKSWQQFGQSEFETNYFVEGACATRRAVFERAGDYYEPLFIYCEGYDLTLRMMNNGFRILYCPQVRLRHLMSAATRSPGRPYYYFTRNYIWIAYKDFPFLRGLRMLVPKLLMMLYFAVRSKRYKPFIRGLWDGVAGLRRLRPDRTPTSEATLRYYYAMEKQRPGLMARLARHSHEPQL